MTSAPPPTVRLVDLCPDCGYSLLGLPEEGRCPECGRAYDQRVMILHGMALGAHATLANASPRRAFWLLVGGLFPFVHSFVFADGVSWRLRGAFVTFFGLLAAAHVTDLIRRWTNPRPGLVQVYLSPTGCLQVDAQAADRPGGSWLAVRRVLQGALVIAAAIWCVMGLTAFMDVWRAVAIVGFLSVVVAVPAYFSWRFRWAGARTVVPPNEIDQRVRAEGHPWIAVAGIELAPVDDRRTELRVRLKEPSKRCGTEAVNADLQCDPARRAEVERLLRAWTIAAVAAASAPTARRVTTTVPLPAVTRAPTSGRALWRCPSSGSIAAGRGLELGGLEASSCAVRRSGRRLTPALSHGRLDRAASGRHHRPREREGAFRAAQVGRVTSPLPPPAWSGRAPAALPPTWPRPSGRTGR